MPKTTPRGPSRRHPSCKTCGKLTFASAAAALAFAGRDTARYGLKPSAYGCPVSGKRWHITSNKPRRTPAAR